MQMQYSRRQTGQNRRRMLATLSSAAAVALIGSKMGSAQEAPPEVTTIRLTKTPGICIAPQYVAEALLKIEGFRDIQYVEVPLDFVHRSAGTDKIDINMGFIASFVAELDLDAPRSHLQFTLDLVEETPVRGLGNDLAGIRFDHAHFA
jgi:NitT/TauT family transport system substrate-binding protein